MTISIGDDLRQVGVRIYQGRDAAVVDYQPYLFHGLWFRGPDPGYLPPGDQLTFLGAAQTLGCFTDRPFPCQVGGSLARPIRNLGYPGAGPRFFVEHPALLDEVNRGAAAVIQVMSGRSEDNRMFRSAGLELLERRWDGALLGSNVAYQALVRGYDPVTGRPHDPRLRRIRARLGRRRLRALVHETRRNWVASYEALFAAIHVPTVLLWLSTRPPAYTTRYGGLTGLFGGAYPQLVDEEMLAAVEPLADVAVRVCSSAGMPQPLVGRVDGRPTTIDPGFGRPDLGEAPWTHNRYYPSPAMHDEAADAVAQAVRQVLA